MHIFPNCVFHNNITYLHTYLPIEYTDNVLINNNNATKELTEMCLYMQIMMQGIKAILLITRQLTALKRTCLALSSSSSNGTTWLVLLLFPGLEPAMKHECCTRCDIDGVTYPTKIKQTTMHKNNLFLGFSFSFFCVFAFYLKKFRFFFYFFTFSEFFLFYFLIFSTLNGISLVSVHMWVNH